MKAGLTAQKLVLDLVQQRSLLVLSGQIIHRDAIG